MVGKMSETLDLVAATGSAIDADLFEDAMHVLVKSAWRNSDEESQLTQYAREHYFDNKLTDDALLVVGRFDDEPVSAAIGDMTQWYYPGHGGEYLGYVGKKAVELSLFGVRIPYRGLGFGTQTLAAVGHAAHLNECSLMAMYWADFQWKWFQARGGFEGRFGLIAESVRSLPVHLPSFETSRLQILD